MPEFEPIHRPALAGVMPIASDRIRIAPLPEGTVLQVSGPAAEFSSLEAAAATSGLALRANGPNQWFLVSDDMIAQPDLPAAFSTVDQSHGRVRIAIEGKAVEDILGKGTALDFMEFSIGAASTTLIGHIATHVTRLGEDRFELIVLRGFAESLWQDLVLMSA